MVTEIDVAVRDPPPPHVPLPDVVMPIPVWVIGCGSSILANDVA